MRPGPEPESSWVLVGFVTTEPWQELLKCFILKDFVHNTNNVIEQSSCVRPRVRPTKLKHRSLEERQAYNRTKQGERVARVQKPWTLSIWGKKFLQTKCGVRATGCGTVFWLVGGEVAGGAPGILAQPEVTVFHLGGGISSCRRTVLLVCCCFIKRYKLKIGIPRSFVPCLPFVAVTVDFWLFDGISLKATHRRVLCKRNRIWATYVIENFLVIAT